MPTPTTQRTTAGAIAVLGCALAAGAAAAQAVPAVPGVQTERFRLVVEGESRATSDFDLAGSNGICNADVNAHVTETTTWRRGRGVVIRFMRLGAGPRAPIVMTRVGSRNPFFEAVVRVTRTSSGAATRTPVVSADQCPPLSESLDAGPDCGTPKPAAGRMSLVFSGALLRLSHQGLGSVVEIDCPVSQVYGGTPEPRFAWPATPALRPELLAPGLIFGRRKAFIVRMASRRERVQEPIAAGPLTGAITHFGRDSVLIRFIRLP